MYVPVRVSFNRFLDYFTSQYDTYDFPSASSPQFTGRRFLLIFSAVQIKVKLATVPGRLVKFGSGVSFNPNRHSYEVHHPMISINNAFNVVQYDHRARTAVATLYYAMLCYVKC